VRYFSHSVQSKIAAMRKFAFLNQPCKVNIVKKSALNSNIGLHSETFFIQRSK
jgi:hypothetical protein